MGHGRLGWSWKARMGYGSLGWSWQARIGHGRLGWVMATATSKKISVRVEAIYSVTRIQ